MKNLELVRSASFGDIRADIYSDGSDMFMTARQLWECLEETKGTFTSRLSRNPYLKEEDFSGIYRLHTPSGLQETRIFNEDGIYEITMLSRSPKAKLLRVWFRKMLRALRGDEAKIASTSEYQKMIIATRTDNTRVQKARELARLSDKYKWQPFAQILDSYAARELTGEYVIPLPDLEPKTYTAAEIGKRLGLSANMVGRLANRYQLKTDTYGKWCKDKAMHADKEVPTFRYFENVISALESLGLRATK